MSVGMSMDDFKNSALVLVGHGSTLNPDSATPTFQHADALRTRKLFSEVRECFWKLEPGIAGVLRGVFSKRIFVVPLFISEGYFTEQVIPRELGLCDNNRSEFPRVQPRGDRLLYYCGPVGTHDSMTDVILGRASQIVANHPFPRQPERKEITLFIAGHGTGNNENSRKAIEHQAELIRNRNLYADVHPVFMEEEPRIGDCYKMAATRNIVMVPFFISDGLHSYEDIPVMLGEPEKTVQRRWAEGKPTWTNPTEKHGKRVWYSLSIGNEPQIPNVILERVKEASQWPLPPDVAPN